MAVHYITNDGIFHKDIQGEKDGKKRLRATQKVLRKIVKQLAAASENEKEIKKQQELKEAALYLNQRYSTMITPKQ